MEKKKFNYGIIGAGHIGKYHIQQIQNIPSVSLIGIFDVDQKQCQVVVTLLTGNARVMTCTR